MPNEHRVSLKGGKSFTCPEGESIMSAIERAGLKDIFIGCRRGGCGACTVQVLEGRVELIRPMSRVCVSEAQQKDGSVLACCASPTTDLLIEVLC